MEKEAKKLYKSTKEKLNRAKRSYICKSLKDVVRGYRNCKTAAQERAFVKKESAHIRDLFREEDTAFRRDNVCKLLFFHMNGYHTEWGQVECLKLCASAKYKDKRVGYLGLMVLLDETQEILMMMTNCLKQDLGAADFKVVSLALTALGNISTPDMIRDLLPDVIKLLQMGPPYARKKAALVGARAVRKLPELSRDFLPEVRKLLSGRSGAVFLTTTTLVLEIAKHSPENLPELRKDVLPMLTDLVKELSCAAYDPDLSVGGVTDPFMQIQAIRALGVLAQGDARATESIIDVLTQVCSSTDASKSAGAGVVSECIKTIYKIPSPSSLRSLALQQLGSFLTSNDANFRYVALSQLATVFHSDPQGVKSHMKTIINCLHEEDPSIRHRAVDLTFAIADEHNVRELTEETLAYVDQCDPELKEDACTRLFDMADRLGPTPEWKVDVFVRLLIMCDEYVREELCDVFVAMVSCNESVHAYLAEKIFRDVLAPRKTSKTSTKTQSDRHLRLDRVAAYLFGEYGELVTGADKAVGVKEALDTLACVLKGTKRNVFSETLDQAATERISALRQVTITAAAKLVTKLVASERSGVGEDTILQARVLISTWRQSIDMEAQQRACEFSTLLTMEMETLRSQVLSRMPPMDYACARARLLKPAVLSTISPVSVTGGTDLISFVDDGPSQASALAVVEQGADPLADILGFGAATKPAETPLALPYDTPLALPSTSGFGGGSLLDDILGPSPVRDPPSLSTEPNPAAAAASTGEAIGPLTVTDKEGLRASIVLHRASPQPQKETEAVVTFINSSPTEKTKLVFQLSVPKYMKLSMQPATSSTLAPNGGTATQTVILTNTMPGEKALQLRYRVEYRRSDNTTFEEQGLVTGIPRNL